MLQDADGCNRKEMYGIVDVYFYACRLIKHKLVTKMTGASFPVIFIKAYRDWILDEKGLSLQVIPSWNLPQDVQNSHDKIFINPTNLQKFMMSNKKKGKESSDSNSCEVLIQSSTSGSSLQITAVPLPGVPTNQIWCSHLAAYNIKRYFLPSPLLSNGLDAFTSNKSDKQTSEKVSESYQKYFLSNVNSTCSTKRSLQPVPCPCGPKLASDCQILVFKTIDLKELDDDILNGLIGTFLTDTGAYFTDGQISRIETEYLKCKEVLYLNQNHTIYIQTQFKQAAEGATDQNRSNNQYYIDPTSTRVTQQFCINARLPRSLTSVPPFAMDVFAKILKLAENNLAEDLRKRMRLRILLAGEPGTGRDKLIKYLAHNLGLLYIETTCQELLADTAAVTEINLNRCVDNLNSCMPTLWNLKNIETLVQDKEGKLDLRMLTALETAINQLNNKSILVGTTSAAEKIPSRLYSLFLDVFQLPSTAKLQERICIIKRIVSEECFQLTQDSLIEWLADKTAGFCYEDIRSVLNSSSLAAAMKGSDTICESDLEASLSKWRKSRSKVLGLAEVPNVKWEDIGGLEDVKAEILEAVSNIGVVGSKRCGILLYGPPGVGKTLLAKAAATQCAMSFISVKGPELLNMYVGQSEENVRTIFKRAKEAEPCIVFFDELDSVAPARGQAGDSGGVMDRVVSALLGELDSLDQIQVIVIGATNRPDLLDPALCRPGRFDKSIYIGTATDPDQQLSILKSQTRKLNLAPDCDLGKIVARFPPDISGAQVSSIVSNAALRAVERCILALQQNKVSKDNVKPSAEENTDKGKANAQKDMLTIEDENKDGEKNEAQVEMVTMQDFLAAVSEFKKF